MEAAGSRNINDFGLKEKSSSSSSSSFPFSETGFKVGTLVSAIMSGFVFSMMISSSSQVQNFIDRVADLGNYIYLFYGAAIFSIMQKIMQGTIMSYRAGVIGSPDDFVYQVVRPREKEGPKDAPELVTLAASGKAGRLNRLQRAYFNTLESIPFVLANSILFGCIMPKLAFIFMLAFVVGRIQYQIGYGINLEARGPGYFISQIATALLETGVYYTCLVSLRWVPMDILFPPLF